MSHIVYESVRQRLQRSELAVPGSSLKMFEKALNSPADYVFLDLEDAVAPDDKVPARKNVIDALNDLDWRGTGKTISVRINSIDTHYMYRDVVEVVEQAGENLDTILLLKAGTASDVYMLSAMLNQIETTRASIGLLMNDVMKIGEVTFMPNGRFEYGKEIIDSSDAIVSYIVYPNTDYTLNFDKEETDNFRVGIGADIEVDGGWLFKADYERNQAINSGYENTISIGASYQPNSSTQYNLSLTNGDSSNRRIGLDFDKMLSDDWSINAGFEVAQTSSSGYNNTAQFSTEMSF